MSWVKLDDQFTDHPKIVAVGPAAAWLYVCGLTYCARLLTDGFIPAAQVRRLADLEEMPMLTSALVEQRLWEPCEGGYRVHEYLDYQPSRERVLADRETNAKRQAEWRDKNRPRNAVTNDVTNAPRNGPVTGAPSISRPTPVESVEGEVVTLGREAPGAIAPPARVTPIRSAPKPKQTTIPESFSPSEKAAEWARGRWPPAWVESQTEQFVLHYQANSKTMSDWDAAWRKWMVKGAEMSPPRRTMNGPATSAPLPIEYEADAGLARFREQQRRGHQP